MEVLNYGGNELSEKLQALDVARANELFLNYKIRSYVAGKEVVLYFSQPAHIDRYPHFSNPSIQIGQIAYSEPVFTIDGDHYSKEVSVYLMNDVKEFKPGDYLYFPYDWTEFKLDLPHDPEGRQLIPNVTHEERDRDEPTYRIYLKDPE